MHNFKSYNTKNGWDNGNKLLSDFSTMLKNHFKKSMLFRIHANDFVILNNKHTEIDVNFLKKIDFLEKQNIKYSVKHQCFNPDEIESVEMMSEKFKL